MAKQLVSPVERHVEKAILAIAVVVLLGTVARYLVGSPNTVELDGTRVTPQTLDEVVFAKAELIRQRIRDATATVEKPEPLVDEFIASLAPLDPNATWNPVISYYPEPPFVDKPGQVAGQYELVEVLPLPKPAVTHGRSTYSVLTDTGTAYVPSNWVTVSSVVDVREQTNRQRLAYGVTRSDLVFGPTEAQRRVQRPDGSWSDDDWELVDAWRVGEPLPEPPPISFFQVDGRVEPETVTVNRLSSFVDSLRKSVVQLELLRPQIPVIENGDAWSFPIITSCRDVLKQDDELLYPGEAPAAEPDDRYGLCGVLNVEEAAANAASRIRQVFDNADTLIAQALKSSNPNDATTAYNLYNVVIRDARASAADKQKAAGLQAKADQVRKDIERQNRLRAGRSELLATDEPGIEKPAREKLPIQQVWVNDSRPGQVASGKTYQYRVRQKFFNRLAGDPGKFREPEDAKLVYVTGAWSEPSDPVIVPPDVEYYVVSQDERDAQVGLRVHQWYEGVWVESRKFQLAVGDPVGGQVRVEVPDLDDPRKGDLALVDFRSNAVLMDLDFNRSFRERKRGGGRDGVRFSDRTKGVCAVAVVDASGSLSERFLSVDKDDPSLRAAQSRKWKPTK